MVTFHIDNYDEHFTEYKPYVDAYKMLCLSLMNVTLN